MDIHISGWMIPVAITIIALIPTLTHDDGGGYFSGINNIYLLIPGLFVSMVSWIIYAIFK